MQKLITSLPVIDPELDKCQYDEYLDISIILWNVADQAWGSDMWALQTREDKVETNSCEGIPYTVGTYATTFKYSFKYFCQFRKSYVTKLVLKRFVKRESRRLGTPGQKDVQYLQILGMRFWERFFFTQTRLRLLLPQNLHLIFLAAKKQL